jgi:hypothetical protein
MFAGVRRSLGFRRILVGLVDAPVVREVAAGTLIFLF